MSVFDWLILPLVFAVYLVGSWTILNWVWERTAKRYYRLWFARKYGVPIPVLEQWEEDMKNGRL